MLQNYLLNPGSINCGVENIQRHALKNIGNTSDTIGAASMASVSSGATIATIASASSSATIHSEVGAVLNAATALFALLPQP